MLCDTTHTVHTHTHTHTDLSALSTNADGSIGLDENMKSQSEPQDEQLHTFLTGTDAEWVKNEKQTEIQEETLWGKNYD